MAKGHIVHAMGFMPRVVACINLQNLGTHIYPSLSLDRDSHAYAEMELEWHIITISAPFKATTLTDS